MQPSTTNRANAAWLVAWTAVGAAYALGVLAILSIGMFLLAIAAVATFFLGRQPKARSGIAGLVSGAGLPLFYVAFLNRSGPGTVCTGHSCVDEWSPSPWLVIGVALVVVGGVWFALRTNRSEAADAV